MIASPGPAARRVLGLLALALSVCLAAATLPVSAAAPDPFEARLTSAAALPEARLLQVDGASPGTTARPAPSPRGPAAIRAALLRWTAPTLHRPPPRHPDSPRSIERLLARRGHLASAPPARA